MRKQEFLDALRARLHGLPEQDLEERLNFYGEMIDDRTEEGLSQEEAVRAVGSIDEIVAQIIMDVPWITLAKNKIKPKRRFTAWEIVFLSLGSPIWLSLLIALFSVILSLYVTLWSLVISAWSVFASLVGGAIGGVLGGLGFALLGSPLVGAVCMGAGLVSAGLSIFCFFGCKIATKCMARGTKAIALGIKKCLIRREDAHE